MMDSRDQLRQRSQDAEMRALFSAFDKDNNGYIDGQELKLTMREVGMDLTNHDVEMMMRAAGVAIKDRIFYEGLTFCRAGRLRLKLEAIQRWSAICHVCISSQGQVLYSHQKLNMHIYWITSEQLQTPTTTTPDTTVQPLGRYIANKLRR